MNLTPQTPITSPDFQYTKAAHTDVQKVWLRHGWTPPDKQKQDQKRLELNRYN